MDDDDDDLSCWKCDGDGYIVSDCFEDTCCCEDPGIEHDIIPCPVCAQFKMSGL